MSNEAPERIFLPADTAADVWNILAKNPSRNWATGESVNNVEYRRVDPPAAPACIYCGREEMGADYCGKQRGLQKCVFNSPSPVAPAAPDEREKALIESVVEPWICVEDKPCEETVAVHWDELVAALTGLLTTVRAEVWRDAIRVAQLSAQKSQKASLNIAAAEILIRRLEQSASYWKGGRGK